MKKRSTPEPEPSPRFISLPETTATLDFAKEVLSALNEDYDTLSHNLANHNSSHPYESVMLFGFDTPLQGTSDSKNLPTTSALLNEPSYDLTDNKRLEFARDSVIRHRVILGQTALGEGLMQDKTPTFRSSKMNFGRQMVIGYPLVTETADKNEVAIGAIQPAFTVNQNPNWVYPTEDEMNKILGSHKKELSELSQALASLASKSLSLSRNLEIDQPTTPNAYVINWDIGGSTRIALSGEYGALDAMIESLKTETQRLLSEVSLKSSLTTKTLDRGDGEFIIIPMENVDLYNPSTAKMFGKKFVQPLIDKLQATHKEIIEAYKPDIFSFIHIGVGLGVVENDANSYPTGRVLYDTARTTSQTSGNDVGYTKVAQVALFGDTSQK